MAENSGQAHGLAEQITKLAQEVKGEKAQRAKAREELAERASAPAWLKRDRMVQFAFAIALPLLGALIIMNAEGLSLVDLMSPTEVTYPPLPPQAALDSVVKEIEGFRQDYSELPSSLAEVGTPSGGDWTYTRQSDEHYRVVLRKDGQVVTFDSRQREGGF